MSLELLGELLDPALDVSRQMIGAFVLRDHSQHLAQPVQALLGIARLAKVGFGRSVFWGQVCWHGCNPRRTDMQVYSRQAPASPARQYLPRGGRATGPQHGAVNF